jgi:hypothetical protein
MHQSTHISIVEGKKENIFKNFAILKKPLTSVGHFNRCGASICLGKVTHFDGFQMLSGKFSIYLLVTFVTILRHLFK